MNIHKINKNKFIFRSIIFVIVILISIYDINILIKGINTSLFWNIKIVHIVWGALMINMLRVALPAFNGHISYGKHLNKFYIPSDRQIKNKVIEDAIKKNSQNALRAAIFWTVILAVIASLYYSSILKKTSLLLISITFFFIDQFCINVWCIFKELILFNKCCNTCRIYNWDHFMYLSPLIFIPSFWTYSLIGMALIIVFQWEIAFAKYPERFIEETNKNLQCGNCISPCKNNIQNQLLLKIPYIHTSKKEI